MSSIFSIPELAIGVGLSEAASAAFEPKVEVPKQSAWLKNPQRVPDLGLIAALVAGGKVSQESGHNMANRLGFSAGTMDSITWLAQNRLDFAVMLRLWRRFGAFDSGDDATLSALVNETLAHEQLDWDYQPWLRRLKHAELIGLGDIAVAIVRGAVPAPSWVPVAPPTTTDNVPRFPVTNIDPVKLANALGFDEDMLRIMTARSGLSLAPLLATAALFRGKLTANDWLLAIAEGDLRTEWAETLKEAARAIPTPGNFVQGHLRGWRTLQQMHDGAALHGMTNGHADLLYQIERRPLGIHAITTGLAKGGTFNPSADEIQNPYSAYAHQASLGPEWYDLAEANKFSPPSAFVIRALLRDGVYTVAHGEKRLLQTGIFPEDAKLIAEHYGAQSGTAADPHVTKAQNQLWTTLHRSYIAAETDDPTATTTLAVLNVAASAATEVLSLWQAERDLIRKQLTPAQIKKAFSNAAVNAATGASWTRDEALAALIERGYATEQASSYLNI